MATVTNNLTRIHDAEGALTAGNLPAGGAGATANTDIFLQGSQSLGKRITVTATTEGFALVDGADNNCSASGTHVGMWLWVTQYGNLDDLRVALCSGVTPASNYKYWSPALAEYPKLGGWLRVWVENNVGGTTAAGTYTASQTRCYGAMVSFSSAPGGTSPNLILDSADFLSGGGAALTLTGTSGLWSDFTTADENTTNQYGVMRNVGGVFNLFARVRLGSSGSSLVFDDANFTIVFPQQSLVSDSWMGIDVDIQNASSNIDWAGGVIRSSGAKKGDLVVIGTSGTFDATGMTLAALRLVTLTSKAVIINSAFIGCGQIDAEGATLTSCRVSGYEGATDTAALKWDQNVDPDGKLDGMAFTKGTASTHAIEFGATAPTTMTLNDVIFSGYNASNAATDSALLFADRGSDTTWTINVEGGTTPSYKKVRAGDTVNIVTGTRTVKARVTDDSGAAIENARVFLPVSASGSLPFDASVTISNSGSTATVTHTSHGLSSNDKVFIEGASLAANNGVFTITVTGVNTYTYTMASSPGSSPTGTITSTFVWLFGLTNVSGEISATRVVPADQAVSGWARKSTSAPYYKTGPITGTVVTSANSTFNAVLISDD